MKNKGINPSDDSELDEMFGEMEKDLRLMIIRVRSDARNDNLLRNVPKGAYYDKFLAKYKTKTAQWKQRAVDRATQSNSEDAQALSNQAATSDAESVDEILDGYYLNIVGIDTPEESYKQMTRDEAKAALQAREQEAYWSAIDTMRHSPDADINPKMKAYIDNAVQEARINELDTALTVIGLHKMDGFDDILRLLNGRLAQLREGKQ